jgi:hypothetical protein
MSDLKDDDDLHRCNQLPLVSIDALTAAHSLSDLNNKTLIGGMLPECLNISFVENEGSSKRWPSYHSKEENKASIIGASAF